MELDHERQMIRTGANEYRKHVAENRMAGRETANDYGLYFLKRSVAPLAQAITDFIGHANGRPGRRHAAVNYLTLFEPEVAAFIAARTILDNLSDTPSLTSVAYAIGSALEVETRLARLEEDHGGLVYRVKQNLANNPFAYRRQTRQANMIHAANAVGIVWNPWPKNQKIAIGVKLVDLFIDSVGLVGISLKHTHGPRRQYQIEPTEELLDILQKWMDRSALLHPVRLPTLIKPVPWTTIDDGGYHHPELKRRIIKTTTKGHGDELHTACMPRVYAALNHLQDTGWRVNKTMLELLRLIWDSSVEVKTLPTRQPIPKPPFPPEAKTDKAVYKKWKLEAAETYRRMGRAVSRLKQAHSILAAAQRFADQPAFYFPYQLDFRGRAYSQVPIFNPQGNDLARGMLEFAEGKPLGKRGAFHLAVHIANLFGYDKVSLEERAEWTKQNTARILCAATVPLEERFWTEAEKPFQFLAACLEWKRYCDEGPSVVSHIACAVDGSCNGIQLFASAMRDEVTGRHVNLVPQEKPADLYAAVATAVEAALRADLTASGTKDAEMAQAWLAWGGISRKLCKRPVMILPYNGSRHAARLYIHQYVQEERLEHARPLPTAGDIAYPKLLNYLTTKVWDALDTALPGPRQAMQWIAQAARAMVRAHLPCSWLTPSGFIVQQLYWSTVGRRVKTKLGDKIVFLCVVKDVDRLDRRRNVQALSPNIIHSWDASVMAATIANAHEAGVASFAAIHDSFGTHACDMDTLGRHIREAFVDIFDGYNWLEDLREQFQEALDGAGSEECIPSPPALGTLDIRQVLNSPFFFA